MWRWFRKIRQAVTNCRCGERVEQRRRDTSCASGPAASSRQAFGLPRFALTMSAHDSGAFHRYDLTSCTACQRCALECPSGSISLGCEQVPGRKGTQITSFTVDYGKCVSCALCAELCPADCLAVGSPHDLRAYMRDGSVVDFSRLPVELAWGGWPCHVAAADYSPTAVLREGGKHDT